MVEKQVAALELGGVLGGLEKRHEGTSGVMALF